MWGYFVAFVLLGLVGLLVADILWLSTASVKVYQPLSPPFGDATNDVAQGDTLRVLTINVWSGSTYELRKGNSLLERITGVGNKFEFYKSETRARRDQRFEALIHHIVASNANIVCLNEVMPCPEFARKVADRLGFDCISHVALSGIVLGRLFKFPKISEGDAILAHPNLKLRFEARQRLSGHVFSSSLSFNLNDATQALCGSVALSTSQRRTAIVATHWHAGLLDDNETMTDLAGLKASSFDPNEIVDAKKRIDKSTHLRVSEALGLVQFVSRMRRRGMREVVICGDLNTTQGTPEFSVLEDAGFRCCFPPSAEFCTWDPKNPNVEMQLEHGVEGQSLRSKVENHLYSNFARRSTMLDHIFISAKSRLSVESLSLVAHSPWEGVVASDHYGLLAQLRQESK